MSYRIAKQTQITDRRLAIEALKLAKMSYRENGSSLVITSGPMTRTSIDLSTGTITGDTDEHGRSGEAFNILRQAYGEAQCRDLSLKQGFTIHNRTTEDENVILWCRTG